MIADKPETRTSELSEIPEALRLIRQWMGTRVRRFKNNPEKLEKPPHSVVGGVVSEFPVSKTDPRNWATFEDAALALSRGAVDAIGIVLMDSDPFYGIDGDGCINRDTGEIARRVADFIQEHDSYAEVSISGEGVRVIGIGEKPSWAKTVSYELGFKVELYDHAAFLVMTGNRISQHTEPQERQRELNALCRELWSKPKAKPGPTRTVPIDLDDEALLEKARNSRKGARFSKLYDYGDASDFKSTSEADWSLTNSLIFWCGADPERVQRLFESSALYRSKADGKDPGYVARNVRKALATYRGALYEPKKVSVGTQQSAEDPLTPYLELLVNPSLWQGKRAASAYKGFCGALRLATESGVLDEEGHFRIGTDMRRLAEASGMGVQTLSASAIPELYKLGLVRWQKPTKKGESGTFILIARDFRKVETIKTSTLPSIVSSLGNPSEAIEKLALLTRMRSGRSSYGSVDRLGPAAMFATIALAFSGTRRGCSLEELEERTGRDKYRLRDIYLPRLKGAGVITERQGLYRLHENFEERWQRNLDLSGITRSEKWQRRYHAKEKAERERRERERSQQHAEQPEEEEYTPAGVFLASELEGVTGMDYDAMLERWRSKGGSEDELKRAIWDGPYRFKREAYTRVVYREGPWMWSLPLSADEGNEWVQQRVYEGMRLDLAVEEYRKLMQREDAQ
jgi:hypothetical protein